MKALGSLQIIDENDRELGGSRLYIETSSRPLYEPTRAFYLRTGYRTDAVLEEVALWRPAEGGALTGTPNKFVRSGDPR